MKSGVFLLTASIVVALAGYLWYRYDAAGDVERSTPLQYIQASKPSVLCEVTQNDITNSSVGTLWLAQGKVRMDAHVRRPNDSFELHMLDDGRTLYAWRDDTKEVSMTSSEDNAAWTSIHCAPWWFVDESLLQVPSFEGYAIVDQRS